MRLSELTQRGQFEETSRRFIAGRRHVLLLACWFFSILFIAAFIVAFLVPHAGYTVAMVIAPIGSLATTVAILARSIECRRERLWQLYSGTPVEFDAVNYERAWAYVKTLDRDTWYAHMGGYVVIFKDPEDAVAARLMVD